jgi:CBS domain containing-hemolysin-like protein
MKKHRLRRLIIADESGHLMGIVTMEDVLEQFSHELADLATALAAARDREVKERA